MCCHAVPYVEGVRAAGCTHIPRTPHCPRGSSPCARTPASQALALTGAAAPPHDPHHRRTDGTTAVQRPSLRGPSPLSPHYALRRRHHREGNPRSDPVAGRHLAGLRRTEAPRVLPGRHRAQGRDGDVRRSRDPREGPAQVAPPRRRAAPRTRPGRGPGGRHGLLGQLQLRVDLDLRAALHLRLPGAVRPCLGADQAPRPAVPRHRLRPRGRRPADRPRRQRLEPGRRGRRALPLGRAGVERRPQRHDARPRAADLGLRDQLRRPRRDRPGQVEPADAEAGPPQLGGGGRTGPGQLHRLPAARLPQRRRR